MINNPFLYTTLPDYSKRYQSSSTSYLHSRATQDSQIYGKNSSTYIPSNLFASHHAPSYSSIYYDSLSVRPASNYSQKQNPFLNTKPIRYQPLQFSGSDNRLLSNWQRRKYLQKYSHEFRNGIQIIEGETFNRYSRQYDRQERQPKKRIQYKKLYQKEVENKNSQTIGLFYNKHSNIQSNQINSKQNNFSFSEEGHEKPKLNSFAGLFKDEIEKAGLQQKNYKNSKKLNMILNDKQQRQSDSIINKLKSEYEAKPIINLTSSKVIEYSKDIYGDNNQQNYKSKDIEFIYKQYPQNKNIKQKHIIRKSNQSSITIQKQISYNYPKVFSYRGSKYQLIEL